MRRIPNLTYKEVISNLNSKTERYASEVFAGFGVFARRQSWANHWKRIFDSHTVKEWGSYTGHGIILTGVVLNVWDYFEPSSEDLNASDWEIVEVNKDEVSPFEW